LEKDSVTKKIWGYLGELGWPHELVSEAVVSAAGDVYVKVDLPAEGLDFEQFSYVLFNLCQVAEQLMVPVLQAQAYDRLDNDPTLKP